MCDQLVCKALGCNPITGSQGNHQIFTDVQRPTAFSLVAHDRCIVPSHRCCSYMIGKACKGVDHPFRLPAVVVAQPLSDHMVVRLQTFSSDSFDHAEDLLMGDLAEVAGFKAIQHVL